MPTRWIGRRALGGSKLYRKLSPSELRARGISPTAERYISSAGDIVSKRQYQLAQLEERTGKRVSLVERARRYLSGVWKYLTGGRRRAAEARQKQAAEQSRLRSKAKTKAKAKAKDEDEPEAHRGLTREEEKLLKRVRWKTRRMQSLSSEERAGLNDLLQEFGNDYINAILY